MTVEIPLGGRKYPGLVALIDDEDYEIIGRHNWYAWRDSSANRTLYARTNVKRNDGSWGTVRMHRLILLGAKFIDHIDGNGLNNTTANLRSVTIAQNNANSRPVGGKSAYKGVTLYSARGYTKWQVRIRHDGRYLSRGYFDSEIDAALAYDQAAREFYGQYAYLNFPERIAA